MIDRDAFLRALAENEDDTETRLVYADLLEENGEPEEAERQRKWPAAKQWLVKFCRETNPPSDEGDPYEMVISYEELIQLGREAMAEREAGSEYFGINCGNNETMCDALREHYREFWQNWSIVTGISLPPDAVENASFSCGC